MKAIEAVIAYSPRKWSKPPMIFRLGDEIPLHYEYTVGAVERRWVQASDKDRDTMIMTAFHTMIVRDKLQPWLVHNAFLEIDEYRKLIARDIKGADEYDPLAM